MSDEKRDPAKAVRAYLDELAAFYGEEEVDDLLDRADGLSDSSELRISDLRSLVKSASTPPTRDDLIITLAKADGQPWASLADASKHTAEIMYGKQADAVLKLFRV